MLREETVVGKTFEFLRFGRNSRNFIPQNCLRCGIRETSLVRNFLKYRIEFSDDPIPPLLSSH